METMERHIEPTFRLQPDESQKFSVSAVRRVLEETVTSQLQGKAWQGEEEAVWTISLTETIKARVKELNFPRYKIIVQVVLGENRHQGVRVASRCLWDAASDNYASFTFKSDTLWCTAMVFGVYTE